MERKKIFGIFKSMSDYSYFIIKYSVMIVCVLLILSLVTLFVSDGFSVHTVPLFNLIRDLYNTGAGILLIAVLGSAIVEDFIRT